MYITHTHTRARAHTHTHTHTHTQVGLRVHAFNGGELLTGEMHLEKKPPAEPTTHRVSQDGDLDGVVRGVVDEAINDAFNKVLCLCVGLTRRQALAQPECCYIGACLLYRRLLNLSVGFRVRVQGFGFGLLDLGCRVRWLPNCYISYSICII